MPDDPTPRRPEAEAVRRRLAVLDSSAQHLLAERDVYMLARVLGRSGADRVVAACETLAEVITYMPATPEGPATPTWVKRPTVEVRYYRTPIRRRWSWRAVLTTNGENVCHGSQRPGYASKAAARENARTVLLGRFWLVEP